MSFVPIFARELRGEPSNRALRKERVLAGLTTAFVLAALLIGEHWLPALNLARLSRWLSLIPLNGVIPFCLLIMGLSRAGYLLAVERREGTLPLLLITRLNGWDIAVGKVLQSLFVQVTCFLATLPSLILPLIVLGFHWDELWRMTLGALNILFFALALGFLASIFGDGPKAVSWCLLLFLPFLAHSTPLGLLLPAGMRESLAAVQWLNPIEPLGHLSSVAGGLRAGSFWYPLLGSHALAWCFVLLAGGLLRQATRWCSGIDAGPRRASWWRIWSTRSFQRSPLFRTRLLNRNPYFWRTSRDRWSRSQIWIMLALPTILWCWLIWLSAVIRGLNITFILVIVIAASWSVTLLILIPSNACAHLAEDRLTGALEMVLGTSLSASEIIRGQWLSLRRVYLVPVLSVIMASTALMIAGYVTDGFGGMLDPEDRGLWLFWWISGILLLPLTLIALCWLSMRRGLIAQNGGHASGNAFVQAVFWPGLIMGLALGNILSSYWSALPLMTAYALFLLALAWRARSVLLADLREAALNRYSYSRASDTRMLGRALVKRLPSLLARRLEVRRYVNT